MLTLTLIAGSSGVAAVAAAPVASAAPAACPWVGSSAPISQRVSQLVARMSLAQEVELMTGSGGSSYVGFTPAIGSLCIPALNLQDGPAGVGDGLGNVTQLPAPVGVAATWDTGAEQVYGQVIGAEQGSKGTNVDLGPTINIVRDPRWGRAFESVGEDPYLNGRLGAADIRGVQSAGTMAQVKHFAVYNQETNRNTPADNAVISDQAMQEIYLPAFAASVGQGAASSVMCSYSYINGTAACQNPYTMGTVLRNQFGYTGFVTSDWGATHSTAGSANAGLDQDMPGNDGFYGAALQSAVQNGQVSQAAVTTAVSQILTQMFAFGLFDRAPAGSPAQAATSAAHQADATQLAEEGTVLLKNTGSLLPLSGSDSTVAVIGTDASTSAMTAGGGSAGVGSSGTVTPLQGIQTAAPSGTAVTYNDGTSDSSAAAAAKAASVAVVFASLGESEGSDLSSIDLGSAADNLITAVAAANPNTIVVLNTGSAVTMPWLSSVKGVLEAWYPGQQDGTAIANILYGGYDPSGHLTVSFPTSLAQVPAGTSAQWPGSNGTVQYSEGVDVGYRWYQSKNLTPLYPFGYGLSYTSFAYTNLHIGALTAGGQATVTATVTNTGTRSGADVAQLYITDPATSGQPPLQLEGFTRVNLTPGQSQTVSFPVTEQNLHYWNTTSNTWATSTGTYGISIGDSSTTLPLTGTLPVTTAQLGTPVTLTNPGPQEGLAGTPVNLTVTGKDTTNGQTLTYTATNLPTGLTLTPTGTITGTPTTPETNTTTVTATDGNTATTNQSFTWTIEPADAVAATPLVGVQGLCLDLSSDSNANGGAVDVYTCNGTDGQEWSVQPNGTVQADGACLDVAGGGTANGTLVDIYACNGSAAQQWQPQSDGALLNPQSGKCLDDTGSGGSGTQVEISTCSGAANQSWVSPAGTSSSGGGTATGQVIGYQGLCLDDRSASTADDNPIQVYTCNGSSAQSWTVESNGSLQVLGKCLDVAGAGTANGTLVDLYTCNGTGAQDWVPQSDGALLNPNSGKCLDDTGYGGSGTQVQIWSCGGTANQSWTLP